MSAMPHDVLSPRAFFSRILACMGRRLEREHTSGVVTCWQDSIVPTRQMDW
jgi:hypothetical protein